MSRRLVVLLLIFGWISLSGFDVVEDLDEIPHSVNISSSSPDSTTAKRPGWGPLANNIVESANETEQVDIAEDSCIAISFEFCPLCDLERHISLHKLYRVFLI